MVGSTAVRSTVIAVGGLLFLWPPALGLCDGNLTSLLTRNNPILYGLPNDETGIGAEESALDINPAALAIMPGSMMLFSYTASTGGGENRRLFVPVQAGAGFVLGAGLATASLDNTGQFDGTLQSKYRSGTSELAFGWSRGSAGFGLRARQVAETWGEATGGRATGDIGTLAGFGDDDRTWLGLAVNNVALNDERPVSDAAIAQMTVLSLGHRFFDDRSLFASLNAQGAIDSAWSLSAGASYRVQPSAAWQAIFRAGYTRAENGPGGEQGGAAGITIVLHDAAFSYTYNALAAGGLSHAAGLRYRFAVRASRQAAGAPAAAVEQADAAPISKIMKDLCSEALRKIDRDRDALIYSRKAGADDLKPLDESRNVVLKLMIDGKYDDAWTLIKYLYQGYIYLGAEIAARDMLKETESQTAKDNDAKSYQVELYKRGLREYMKKDMGSAITSMNRYIGMGGQFYRDKARQILAAAYLKSGMDSYNDGDSVTAASQWRNGLRNDPENVELARCLKEYIEAGCNEQFNEGMIAYSQGDLETAEMLWKKCLAIDPEYERAEKALKRLK